MRLVIAVLSGTLLLAASAWSETRIFLGSPVCLRLEAPVLQPFTVEVQAWSSSNSFIGAEFAIGGFTPERGFQVLDVRPNPRAILATGNPFAEGARILFGECLGDPTRFEPVTLYTATVMALQPFQLDFPVTAPSNPPDPSLQCPTVFECSGSAPRVCAFVNDPSYVEHIESPPGAPTPPDGATNVPVDFGFPGCDLHNSMDCNCLGDFCFALWLGQDPDPPFYGVWGCGWDPLPPPKLQGFTKYYWRFAIINCGSGTTPVFSFTTGAPIAVTANMWGRVKQLYR